MCERADREIIDEVLAAKKDYQRRKMGWISKEVFRGDVLSIMMVQRKKGLYAKLYL